MLKRLLGILFTLAALATFVWVARGQYSSWCFGGEKTAVGQCRPDTPADADLFADPADADLFADPADAGDADDPADPDDPAGPADAQPASAAKPLQ